MTTNTNTKNHNAQKFFAAASTSDLDSKLTEYAGRIALGEMTGSAWGVFNGLVAAIRERAISCTSETEGRYEIRALVRRSVRVEQLAAR